MDERGLLEAIAELHGQVRELQDAVVRLRLDLDQVEYRQVPDVERDIGQVRAEVTHLRCDVDRLR
jgi:hypothetical protein